MHKLDKAYTINSHIITRLIDGEYLRHFLIENGLLSSTRGFKKEEESFGHIRILLEVQYN